MSDLIDRQAAIYAAKNLKVDEEEYCEYDVGFNDGIIEVVKMLYKLPSAQPEQRWIPLSESLPELYKDVLVWYVDDYNIACLVQIDNIKYWHFESSEMDSNIDNVTAWMPLPAPWKGES